MNSFLDTNILIGYIFVIDLLFKHSEKFFLQNSNYYYSKHVKKEVLDIFFRKSLAFDEFFLKLYDEIDKYDDSYFLSKAEIHYIINKFEDIGKMQINDMQFSFERIWNYFDFGEHQEVMLIKIKLSKFFYSFAAFHNLRKNSVLNEMILISNHTNKDKQILEKIEENHLREELLHSNDEKILFDANEFCKNNVDLKLNL